MKTLKGLFTKLKVSNRKSTKVDIPVEIVEEVQSKIAYCRLVEPHDWNNRSKYERKHINIIIEFFFTTSKEISRTAEDFIIFENLLNILGIPKIKYCNDNKTWFAISINSLTSLDYLVNYLSKESVYCNNQFITMMINLVKYIPYVNILLNYAAIDAYEDDEITIFEDSNKPIFLDNTRNIHFDFLDTKNLTAQQILKNLLPLLQVVIYNDNTNDYDVFPLQYFAYKLAFDNFEEVDYDKMDTIINYLNADYSNIVMMGKHIVKDVQSYIDLPLPVNEDDEESEDSSVNDSYYSDIDEVIDK